jgi:hypothetical protein
MKYNESLYQKYTKVIKKIDWRAVFCLRCLFSDQDLSAIQKLRGKSITTKTKYNVFVNSKHAS